MKLEAQRRPAVAARVDERPLPRPHFSLNALTRGFSALTVRNYRLFFIGQVISLTGSWMQRTAQDWLVIQLTHSPFALGLVTTFQFLPVMLLSLFGGAMIDRLPKHKLLVVTQAAMLAQAAVFGLLVFTNLITIEHVYILAAIQGIITAVDNPARQALVPALVGRENLVNAVALNSMVFNGTRIIGPAVAGLLIANIGIAPALFLNAASFIPVIAGLFMMNVAEMAQAAPQAAGNMLHRIAEGLRYVWRTPAVLLVMIVMAAIGTFGYNFSVILPMVAGFVLKTGPDGLGALSAFVGFGSMTAALTTAYARNVTQRRLLLGAAAFSILLGAVALSSNFALTAVLLVALGFAGIIFATSANTLIQLTVPDELRGRVMSLYILLFAGSTPVGGLVIGTLSSLFGVSWALASCAGLCMLGVIGAAIYRHRTARILQTTLA